VKKAAVIHRSTCEKFGGRDPMRGVEMIDRSWAEAFAKEWVANWNARDLDALLSHYSPSVVFRSPLIFGVLGQNRTYVAGIGQLRDYWQQALSANKELHFDLTQVLVGSDAITIYYRNHRRQDVAETLVFGKDLKAIEGIVTYS
jgi:ketosteroid isomerase-like protein